jgi:hypothetical protein
MPENSFTTVDGLNFFQYWNCYLDLWRRHLCRQRSIIKAHIKLVSQSNEIMHYKGRPKSH